MNALPGQSESFRMCPLRIIAFLYIALTLVAGIARSLTAGDIRVLMPLLFAAGLTAWRRHARKPLWMFPDELLVVLPLWCGLAASGFGLETTWFPGLGLLIGALCTVGACRSTAGVLRRGGYPATALLLAPPVLLVFSTVLAKATGGADRMQLSALHVQIGLAFGGVPVSWLAWPPQASAGIVPEESVG